MRTLKPLVRLQGARVERVHELFLTGTRMWNTEEVYKSFLSLEAREVLKVKLSSFSETDVLAWAFEKHGVYSVR